MSVAGWIVVGVLAWVAVALVVAVLVGRMVRLRDRQVPEDPLPRPAPEQDPSWPGTGGRTPRTPEPRRPRR
ncbi:hypothetical protein LWC35_01320 [Pseudonocardia kujensis]|uniref:hypothetical protein n=1 Tax=Pseudonocardia kujensis TaxID=1128675 RepID=UPI001E4003DF|nr:hypothetical protein [Pseudonocardia kujensis]MCE0761562.1 hypothetical protein [Pseudonocardia kujensis]